MDHIYILNDVHLGVRRVAGTTPSSAADLKDWLLSRFEDDVMLDRAGPGSTLIILGDLFDGFEVDNTTVLRTYLILATALRTGPLKHLVLVQGNHDYAPRGSKISSFDLLASLLMSAFPHQVDVVRDKLRSACFDNGVKVHIIGHCPNQDLFEIELENVLEEEPGYLMLHCNLMNPFAEQADHSLNLTQAWAERLAEKHTLLIAHEHQHRTLNIGKGIHVLGNQRPSSVSDCLPHAGQKDGVKYLHTLCEEGLTRAMTWSSIGSDGFAEHAWNSPDPAPEVEFLRIVGDATATQSADVVSRIARIRRDSKAYVVSNAVRIDGVCSEIEQLAEMQMGKVKAFDVLGALLELLEPAEQEVIRRLHTRKQDERVAA